MRSAGRAVGFITARPGTNAVQIGPCLGPAPAAALLLAEAARRYAGQPVILDIPTDNLPAVRQAEVMGLIPQRSFLRMNLGDPVPERIAELWASFGPEKG
jgi:hypothetical protein